MKLGTSLGIFNSAPWLVVRPGKASTFSEEQAHRGKSQKLRSLDGREEGNRVI
jgi:hypothetical protein